MVKENKQLDKELDVIEISEEQIDNIKKLRGSVIKEFFSLKEDSDEDAVLGIFIRNALKTIDIEVTDPYEELELSTFGLVLEKVLEQNNLDQLFRAFERLNRG